MVRVNPRLGFPANKPMPDHFCNWLLTGKSDFMNPVSLGLYDLIALLLLVKELEFW